MVQVDVDLDTAPSDAPSPTGNEALAGLKADLRKKLTGFDTSFPEDTKLSDMCATRPEAKEFPVPDLVHLLLVNILGFPSEGHCEKVRWSIYAMVDGEPVVFEWRKFGFTILHRQGTQRLERIVGQLKGAIRVLEKALEPLANNQIDQGRVLIGNRFGAFERRYRFFRNHADKAFRQAAREPRKSKSISAIGTIDIALNHYLKHRRKHEHAGFCYSAAMVDAFFSRLEHRLILLRAFTGRPLGQGEFRKLVAARWDQKFHAVALVKNDRSAELIVGQLRRIKERIRNPLSHGGIENDGGSLHVHMPGVGTIPGNFTRYKDSVSFKAIPVDVDDHQEVCSAFDLCDAVLEAGHLKLPHEFVAAGVDPSFDNLSLERYAASVDGGPAAVREFVEGWSGEWERHANMDY